MFIIMSCFIVHPRTSGVGHDSWFPSVCRAVVGHWVIYPRMILERGHTLSLALIWYPSSTKHSINRSIECEQAADLTLTDFLFRFPQKFPIHIPLQNEQMFSLNFGVPFASSCVTVRLSREGSSFFQHIPLRCDHRLAPQLSVILAS